MHRLILLKNLASYTRNSVKPLPRIFNSAALFPSPSASPLPILSLSKFRFFSSSETDNDSSATTTARRPDDSSKIPEPDDSSKTQEPNSSEPSPQDVDLLLQSKKEEILAGIEDIGDKELKARIEKYYNGDEEALTDVMEAILKRKLVGNHEDTDDELMESLRLQPLDDDVDDEDFESDREELLDTDEDIDDLYNTTPIVQQNMADDPYFNMDDKKWDEMISEAIQHGYLRDTREAEEVLEEMLSWDKLLPDEIKKKVEDKFNELGDMCERGELEPEEAYKLFKEFEDETVLECAKLIEEQDVPEFDDSVPDKSKNLDDPPGEGPILRWQTRCVFAPGGDAWHPKNRKVKMAVTVKELGLSKHQFRRLRDLAGKRYHPGKDELTITSERYEHREENRKDCLRTLFNLIEEAGKAKKMADDARASYCKDKLRANPVFMEKLRAKVTKMKSSNALPV